MCEVSDLSLNIALFSPCDPAVNKRCGQMICRCIRQLDDSGGISNRPLDIALFSFDPSTENKCVRNVLRRGIGKGNNETKRLRSRFADSLTNRG